MKKAIYLGLGCLSLMPIVAGAAGVQVSNPRDFQTFLAAGYSMVADMEDGDATDLSDAHVMSDRAVAAFNGNSVLPLDYYDQC